LKSNEPFGLTQLPSWPARDHFVKMRISDLAAVLFGVTVNSILLWQKGLGEIGCYKIVMAKKDLFKYSEH